MTMPDMPSPARKATENPPRAEFAFSTSTKHRRNLTDTSARRRPFFANIVPAKRSRPARDIKGDGSGHQSLAPPADDVGDVDDESSGGFEFSGQHAPGRRVRQRVRIDTSATSSIVAPSVPLEVEGSTTSHGSYAVPSPAPAVKDFDMSLFRKPGEWKCEACLVKNPSGGDKCLSCEIPKPGAGGGGAAVAAGSGELGAMSSIVL